MRIRWAVCGLPLMVLSACGEGEPPLIPSSMIVGDGIESPLTDARGDPGRGAVLFESRDGGHCVLCHVLETVDAPFQGNIGPSMTGIGERLSPAQIRLRIAQPSVIWPDTMMPSYYSREARHQVASAYRGETILTAGEIEDLVAFLAAQRTEVGNENG